MRNRRQVAVVGAGVVGLATASVLLDAGVEVRLFERDAPGMAQSIGRTRVFRVAHGDPALVDLALRAERLWRDWEDRFKRRLVSHAGLIITGDETARAWTQAMADAGARHETLSAAEAASRLPIGDPQGAIALFDPAAGPTRARRTIDCLLSLCSSNLVREEVLEIEPKESSYIVRTVEGHWECDEVIISAGVDTGRLAAGAGITVETRIVPDSRFSFTIAKEYRSRSLPCWFDRSGAYGPGYTSYGQQVGSTDWYAVAVGWGDVDVLDPDEESAMHRQKLVEYLPHAYPGLDPVPVDEIRCSYMLRAAREDGDGFVARRSGGVTALFGSNLFKFAPLLGEFLGQTAVEGELAPELTMFSHSGEVSEPA